MGNAEKIRAVQKAHTDQVAKVKPIDSFRFRLVRDADDWELGWCYDSSIKPATELRANAEFHIHCYRQGETIHYVMDAMEYDGLEVDDRLYSFDEALMDLGDARGRWELEADPAKKKLLSTQYNRLAEWIPYIWERQGTWQLENYRYLLLSHFLDSGS